MYQQTCNLQLTKSSSDEVLATEEASLSADEGRSISMAAAQKKHDGEMPENKKEANPTDQTFVNTEKSDNQ